MTRSAAIQDRVAGAILDAAAGLLARGGEPPSMNDVAQAAGVARATLYRHFPTREQLLQALATTATGETAARLAEADLDAVPVAEAIARVARVVAAGGSKYAAVIDHYGPGYADGAEQQITVMIDGLLRRGIDDGTFRGDISAGELGFLLGELLHAAARMTAERKAGVEKAAALVTSVFLHGTGNREDPSAQHRGARHRAGTGPEQNSNTEDGRSRKGTGARRP
jgi:TetR/AcrR family transcriptional regulator, mexCD-oprJ operon repressor